MPNNDDLERALEPVLEALKHKRHTEAARRLVEALAHGPAFELLNSAGWLRKRIGDAGLLQIVRAFAAYPCIGCKNGLEPCAECGGKGAFKSGRICDICLGLGATDCGFCAGSGLITYNFVPTGIRLAVVLERCRLVFKQADALLASKLPSPERSGLSAATKSVAQQLIAANRLLDTLNNAVGETRAAHAKHSDDTLRNRISSTCLTVAGRLNRRVRELLRAMLELSVQAVTSTDDPAKRKALARRATFYKKLAASPNYHGTGLRQVYLEEALRDKKAANSA